MHLLTLIAMEKPVSFNPAWLQAEMIKLLSAGHLTVPFNGTINCGHGQYAAGWQGGEKWSGWSTRTSSPRTPTPRASPLSSSKLILGVEPRCYCTYEPGND